MDKLTIIRLAAVLLLALLIALKVVVVNRLEKERRLGLDVFCFGFLTAIIGLALASFFDRIELGAQIISLGILVSAAGLVTFWVRRNRG